MAKERLFLGLSSGWAADGVDAAVVSVTSRAERMKVKQVSCAHYPFSDSLSRCIRSACRTCELTGFDLAEIDAQLAAAFVQAAEKLIRQTKVDRNLIVSAGSSGQVIARWAPKEDSDPQGPCTMLELANPALIAQRLQLPVAANFPTGDLAAGGLGGPITAWVDWIIFRDRRLSRVVVHLGGIISMTFVPGGAVASDVVAFEPAPGTIIIDTLASELFKKPFDRDGAIASRGSVCEGLLNEILSHRYFHAAAPKLTFPGQWDKVYVDRLIIMGRKHRCSDADIIATCTEMIARSIFRSIAGFTERPHEIILAGGGGRNIHLAQRIRMLLSPSSTYAIEHYGFDSRCYRAACYAVLAAARIDNKPAHCPSATGARRQAVLGAIWVP